MAYTSTTAAAAAEESGSLRRRLALLLRETRADIKRGAATLGRSLEIVAGAFTGPRDGTYTRSSSLFDQAEQRLQRSPIAHKEADLAIRDLRAIDETMADMATSLHLMVTDYDTVEVPPG